MAEELAAKNDKASPKLAFVFETLLSTMMVGIASASNAENKGIYATCGPVVAFMVAHGINWLHSQYLYYRFKKEIKEEIQDLRDEQAHPNTSEERKVLIQAEIADLRKLRQKQWAKRLEIEQ